MKKLKTLFSITLVIDILAVAPLFFDDVYSYDEGRNGIQSISRHDGK